MIKPIITFYFVRLESIDKSLLCSGDLALSQSVTHYSCWLFRICNQIINYIIKKIYHRNTVVSIVPSKETDVAESVGKCCCFLLADIYTILAFTAQLQICSFSICSRLSCAATSLIRIKAPFPPFLSFSIQTGHLSNRVQKYYQFFNSRTGVDPSWRLLLRNSIVASISRAAKSLLS